MINDWINKNGIEKNVIRILIKNKFVRYMLECGCMSFVVMDI